MDANQQTSERPTCAEFTALLNAFAGAVNHASWAAEYGTTERGRIAEQAAEEARAKVIAAAMAPCPSCGMQLK